MKRRPWWHPGEDNYKPEHHEEPSSNVALKPDPKPDEVVLVRQADGTIRAVYRRFIRES